MNNNARNVVMAGAVTGAAIFAAFAIISFLIAPGAVADSLTGHDQMCEE
jgi:hypothetical protein